jgi:hypothetical protein
MALERHTGPFQFLADRLAPADLRALMNQAGNNEALRLSIVRPGQASPSSIATLIRRSGPVCPVEVVYDYGEKPYRYAFEVPLADYQALLLSLRRNQFEKLDDEEGLGAQQNKLELWRIERTAGHFYHDILLCPATAGGHHRELVLALRQRLPEAVRELNL